MQTRSFPSNPDGRSCRGRDPAADRRRDRRHDPLHRPARSGESGDRPRHRERVLACSLGRGRYGDETPRGRRRPFWREGCPSTFRLGPPSSIAAPVSTHSSSSASPCRPGPATRKRRSSRGRGNRLLPKVDDSVTPCGSSPRLPRLPEVELAGSPAGATGGTGRNRPSGAQPEGSFRARISSPAGGRCPGSR